MSQSIAGGIDDALTRLMKDVERQQNLTIAELTEISMAGAEVYEKDLRDETRAKHYSSHKDSKYGHMADHITKWVGSKGKNKSDTDFSGVVTVGWDNWFHGMNAMRLNDGTRKISADHFVDNLRCNPSLRQAVFEAEQKKYKEIMDRKRSQGGD